jgi:hypothetical protein
MVTNERKHLDPTALALKQASVVRTLVIAKAAYERGVLKAVQLPPGVSAPPVREIRVSATN